MVKIRYNKVYNFGLGILNDFGGIYTGPGAVGCTGGSIQNIVNKKCYNYKHIYNNLVYGADSYHSGGNLIYTDETGSKNLIENNVLLGAPGKGGSYIYHHCGMDNEARNNIIYRNEAPPSGAANTMWSGCEKDSKGVQKFHNHHNIYYLENVDNLKMGRGHDRYYAKRIDGFTDEKPQLDSNIYYGTPDLKTKSIFPGTVYL